LLILHERAHRTPLGRLRLHILLLTFISHIIHFQGLGWCMVLCPLIACLAGGHRCGHTCATEHSRTNIVDGATRQYNLLALLRTNNLVMHISLVLCIKMGSMHLGYKRIPVTARDDLLIVRLVTQRLIMVNAKGGLLV
jgi:hypothetical protein